MLFLESGNPASQKSMFGSAYSRAQKKRKTGMLLVGGASIDIRYEARKEDEPAIGEKMFWLSKNPNTPGKGRDKG
jgi:hypothetical protein